MQRLLTTICLAALLALAGTASADAHGATYTTDLSVVELHFIGLVPGGLRLNSHFEGTITDGLFAGSSVTGIDYALIRPDGVIVMNGHKLIMIPDGPPIAVAFQGYWVPTSEMPPLEAFLDPEFEMPDMDMPGQGVAWHETMLPQYAHLNRTLYVFTGTINAARGEIRGYYRPLTE